MFLQVLGQSVGVDMACFVKIVDTKVVNGLIVNTLTIDDLPYPESEPIGQAFIASLGLDGDWLQTSYNANFRALYAGIGYTYDAALDEFVAPPSPEPVPSA